MSGHDLVRNMRAGGKSAQTESGRGGGRDNWLVFAVLLVAVGLLGYFGIAWWVKQRAPEPPAAPSVAVASAPAEPAAWTEKDTAQCRAFANKAGSAPIPSEMTLAVRSVTDGFGVMASYLECQLTTKITRLCSPEAKAVLVGQVNDYLARTDLITTGLHLQGAPMAVLGEMFGGEISAGSSIYDIEKDSTFAYMKMYNDRVVLGLKKLAQGGLIEASDFGSFMGMGVPAVITEMIGSIKPERRGCALR